MSRQKKDIKFLSVPELWKRMESIRAKIIDLNVELSQLEGEFKTKTNQPTN